MYLNILCLVCINLQYTYAEFDKKAWILPNFQLEHIQ